MRPVVAIVGRPNVGKSTLFNRLIGRRKAITAGEPGVTRDLNFADIDVYGRTITIVDTGGFEPEAKEGIMEQVRNQARLAIEEADVIVLLMDGRTGPTPQDIELVDLLRRSGKPVVHAANKIDSPAQEHLAAEFFSLGIERILPVSAEHGLGINELLDAVMENLPETPSEEKPSDRRTGIAVVGRPNVGKSSLVNRLLKKERVIVSETPGTTRDAVDTPFEYGGRRYLLVDTAGMRRKKSVTRTIEAYSVMGAVRSIERADVVILVLDATTGIVGQDEKIAGLIERRGKNCLIAVNKWDAVDRTTVSAASFTEEIRRRLPGLHYAPVLFISALTGRNVHKLFARIEEILAQSGAKIPTSLLNRVLEEITTRHRPPVYRGKEIKFFYATQKSSAPPTFLVFVNHPEGVPEQYRRYLVNSLSERLELKNVPVRVVLRRRR